MKMSSKVLVIASVIVIMAIGLFLLLRSVFKEDDETETVYCGADQTLPTKVFKNPTKAFPSFTKEFSTKVTTSMELIDSITHQPGIKGSANLELTGKIVELRDKLNQESARMEMIMKSNFFAYNSKPCDEQISRQYFDLLKIMAEKNSELEKLKAELTKPASKGGDTTQLIIETDTTRIHSAIGRFFSNYRFVQ